MFGDQALSGEGKGPLKSLWIITKGGKREV